MKKVIQIIIGSALIVMILLAFKNLHTDKDVINSSMMVPIDIETQVVVAGEEGESEEETESQTKEPEPVPQIRTVTISAVGDCALGPVQTRGYAGSFHEYYDNFGADYFFKGVKEVFSADDFTLVNLECVLSDEENAREKTWTIKGKPEYVQILTDGSVEACSLGNNHTQDYGDASLTDTQNVLTEAGILYGYNEHTASYLTEDGISIGVVSASLLSKSEQSENYIKDGIARLREAGTDIVIACCHWGTEGEHMPTDYQIKTGRKIVDWGADMVIGTHPHVLQGMEEYNGKIICYSLGNFCFGANGNPSDKNTLIFQQRFTFIDGVKQDTTEAWIIPCRLSSVPDYNDYQPTLFEGDEKQAVIDKMNEYSKAYRDRTFRDDGYMITEIIWNEDE